MCDYIIDYLLYCNIISKSISYLLYMTNLFKSSDNLFNKYANPEIHWKGRTFQQISAGIKFNKTEYPSSVVSVHRLFKALPLKIYRKEIASLETYPCNPRTSLKLTDFDQPGGCIVTQIVGAKGLATTMDFNYENNTGAHPSTTSSTAPSCTILSPQLNARRRVRSSGMIPRKFNTAKNNDTYYTNTNQYLTSRNRSYLQNQYFHIRQGNAQVKPGTNLSSQNIYSANGLTHCPKFIVTTPTSFSYNWFLETILDRTKILDGNVPVNIGSYDIVDMNNLLHTTMIANKHYYIETPQNNFVFLLNFVYNTAYKCIEIQALAASVTLFPPSKYTIPGGAMWETPTPLNYYNINPPVDTSLYIPQIIFTDSTLELKQGFGFTTGSYPSNQKFTTNQYILGTKNPGLQPNYVPIYYKPNNPQFATQGAVSSGDFITRKKYDAITTSASSFRSAFGNQTADALAYGAGQYGYTIKERIGYPSKKTPTFSKYSNVLKKCSLRKITNEI